MMQQYVNFRRRWRGKCRIHFIFFLNSLKLSVPIGLLLTIFVQIVFYGNFIQCLCCIIPTVGFGLGLFYKEMSSKNEYFFFYNLGIGKIELWVSAFLLTSIFCLLLNKMLQLCLHAWRLIVY